MLNKRQRWIAHLVHKYIKLKIMRLFYINFGLSTDFTAEGNDSTGVGLGDSTLDGSSFSPPLVIPITEKFTHFTSSVRKFTRTNIPVRAKLGTIIIRHRVDDRPFNFELASWGSLTIRVPNFFCPPTIYTSGVSVIKNGSSFK